MSDESYIRPSLRAKKNNVVSGVELQISLRLNGHPSGPSDQAFAQHLRL
jgi:hypothetical protein